MGGGKGPVVGLLLLLLLHAGRSEAGLSYTVQPPTRDQCLYVSDFRGIAQVFSVDPTQAALVEASLATSNTTNLIDKGDLVQILEDIGYGAGGMAIYNDILYVASLRIIAQYNISNNLERLDNFVELAFVPFACLPDGLVAANEVLYLTCGAFVGGFNVTYPILKFSLSAPDYGTYSPSFNSKIRILTITSRIILERDRLPQLHNRISVLLSSSISNRILLGFRLLRLPLHLRNCYGRVLADERSRLAGDGPHHKRDQICKF